MFSQRNGSMAFYFLLITAAAFFGGSPIIYSPFLGDDLETWNFFLTGAFPSSFQDALIFSGLEKWRPGNSLAMQIILRALGNSYLPYWYFSFLLILILALVALWCLRLLFTEVNIHADGLWLGLLAIVTSPFTFMARSGVYGFLELAPLILCIASYAQFAQAAKVGDRTHVVYSSLLALSAGLIHERFFAFSIALMLISIVRGRQQRHLRGLWLLYLANGVFYVYTSTIVLRVNVLKGGGADSLNEVYGWWIAPRLLHAIVHVLGGSGAETTYFKPTQPTSLYQGLSLAQEYNLLLPTAFLATTLLLALFTVFRFRTTDHVIVDRDLYITKYRLTRLRTLVELALISFFLIIPAATVNSRIEARWLFAPSVFIIMALVGLTSARDQLTRSLGRVLILLLLAANLLNHRSFDEFDWWRTRTENVLNVARELSPSSGYWEIAIVVPNYPEENNSVTWWGLNYGQALTNYIDNGPNGIHFGRFDVVANCNRPCLVLTVVDDPLKQPDIDRASNQQITYRWLNP